jgi:hypothetical protein
MHELRINLSARQRNIANGERVSFVSRGWLVLGSIDCVIGSGIKYDGGIGGCEDVLHSCRIDYIYIGTFERCYLISTPCEYANEFAAELTGLPEHRNPG